MGFYLIYFMALFAFIKRKGVYSRHFGTRKFSKEITSKSHLFYVYLIFFELMPIPTPCKTWGGKRHEVNTGSFNLTYRNLTWEQWSHTWNSINRYIELLQEETTSTNSPAALHQAVGLACFSSWSTPTNQFHCIKCMFLLWMIDCITLVLFLHSSHEDSDPKAGRLVLPKSVMCRPGGFFSAALSKHLRCYTAWGIIYTRTFFQGLDFFFTKNGHTKKRPPGRSWFLFLAEGDS